MYCAVVLIVNKQTNKPRLRVGRPKEEKRKKVVVDLVVT